MDSSPFVGDWDLYSGGMHSELHLDASGSYLHSLWGVRQHWGTWALEDQNNFTYLTLYLGNAVPRVAAEFLGLTPVAWPTFEAWPIVRSDPDTVVLQDALMHRKAATSPAIPPFVPPQPIAPLPMPAEAMPPPPIFPFPSAIPEIPPPTMGSSPAIQSVLDQWKHQHSEWDKVRRVAAHTFQIDAHETNQLNKMYAGEFRSEQKSAETNIANISIEQHKFTNEFITKYIKGK